MRNPSKREKILGSIVAIQALVILAQFAGVGSPTPARADSQLMNPGERQLEMIDELKGVNGRLDKVLSLMQSGEFQVKVSKPDDAKPDDAGR